MAGSGRPLMRGPRETTISLNDPAAQRIFRRWTLRFPQRSLSAFAALAASLALLTTPAIPPAVLPAAVPVAAADTGGGCDPIDPAACLLPLPNDWYTVADGGTAT